MNEMEELCKLFQDVTLSKEDIWNQIFQFDIHRLRDIYFQYEKKWNYEQPIYLDLEPIPQFENYISFEMIQYHESLIDENAYEWLYHNIQDSCGRIPNPHLIKILLEEYRNMLECMKYEYIVQHS
jgi:hypothetical protein